MSFEKMKRDDLYTLATDEFGVELEANATKAEIIAALAEDGVTYDDAKQTSKVLSDIAPTVEAEVRKEQAEAKAAEEQTLLRMMRENSTYQVRGYTFTKGHPYAIVAASDAEWITENVDGFRYATPKEAAEFYS